MAENAKRKGKRHLPESATNVASHVQYDLAGSSSSEAATRAAAAYQERKMRKRVRLQEPAAKLGSDDEVICAGVCSQRRKRTARSAGTAATPAASASASVAKAGPTPYNEKRMGIRHLLAPDANLGWNDDAVIYAGVRSQRRKPTARSAPAASAAKAGPTSVPPSSGPLSLVTAVVTDVTDDYVLDQLELGETPDQIVQDLLNARGSYPKRRKILHEAEVKPVHEVNYANRERTSGPQYRKEALEVLYQQFPHVKRIKKRFRECNYLFYPTLLHLRKLQEGSARGESGEPAPISHLTDCALRKEIRWARKVDRKAAADAKRESDEKAAKERRQKKAEEDGTAVECGCCYGDFSIEDMVSCCDGHLFCDECLKRYAQERLFGLGDAVLKCFSAHGCTKPFPEASLKKALPKKSYDKFNEMTFQRDVNMAFEDCEELVTCPFCDYKAELDLQVKVFSCPGCGRDSCRLCHDEAHIPLRCSEVEKKSDTDRRRSVEEAMTEAKL
ncbi:unnamed protein product, partial [Chrysoparadoxa australica]